ncbi:hypothetical protein MLD38_014249 [Melastoma candidum]|uniref:Uncharacterized protein n=1 Tax=Melastoma candidum TaxID=119954 RepID=A0ACB9RDC1_9MYRT|nr:hypothetical protein MLD38_014249 [Melastoma candidum]
MVPSLQDLCMRVLLENVDAITSIEKIARWLAEEQLSLSLKECDMSNLMVLQLDQCGRCLPDYIMYSSLARGANSLPALSSVSITAACRLFDSGLKALVSSAPNIRSINLSQCSLLTSAAIQTLANTLGAVLKELYLGDCHRFDIMVARPAFKKLEQLEVLPLAAAKSVNDDFIGVILATQGPILKELILDDCTYVNYFIIRLLRVFEGTFL